MSQLSGLIKQRADQDEFVARAAMARKLADNKEFKKLILREFCVEECARYAQNSGNPGLTAEQRADSLAFAQAAGTLRRWLSVIVQMGDQAERLIPDLDANIEAARLEAQQADDEAGSDA